MCSVCIQAVYEPRCVVFMGVIMQGVIEERLGLPPPDSPCQIWWQTPIVLPLDISQIFTLCSKQKLSQKHQKYLFKIYKKSPYIGDVLYNYNTPNKNIGGVNTPCNDASARFHIWHGGSIYIDIWLVRITSQFIYKKIPGLRCRQPMFRVGVGGSNLITPKLPAIIDQRVPKIFLSD